MVVDLVVGMQKSKVDAMVEAWHQGIVSRYSSVARMEEGIGHPSARARGTAALVFNGYY